MASPAQEEHRLAHSSEQHVYRHALNPFTSDAGLTIVVTGRSIAVKKDLAGTSVANAYIALATRIWKNKVRQDYTANMRHEKKGVKRRRLESERWRRRFADHVRSASQQVFFSVLISPIPEHRSGRRSSSSKRSDDEAPKHAYIHMVSHHMDPYHTFSTIR